MSAAGLLTQFTKLMETPLSTSFPLAQLILGCIGLCSMVSYAVSRQRIIRKRESGQQISLTDYLFPYVREWFGGQHGATGHAGAAGK